MNCTAIKLLRLDILLSSIAFLSQERSDRPSAHKSFIRHHEDISMDKSNLLSSAEALALLFYMLMFSSYSENEALPNNLSALLLL